MAGQFQIPEDIGNRAAQHVGASRFTTFEDTDSKAAAEIGFAYDKVRQAELRSNTWRYAIKRAVLYPINTFSTGAPTPDTSLPSGAQPPQPTMQLVPPVWSATATYPLGAIVQDSAGNVWVSQANMNVNQQPGGDGVLGWDTYFGSMCVQPYDTTGTTTYFTGDLVYTISPTGNYSVFVALTQGAGASQLNNGEQTTTFGPTAVVIWSATASYQAGQVVTDGSYFYMSTINFNTALQPGVYFPWSSAVTYTTGQLVAGSDGYVYTAVQGSTNQNPINNVTYWTKGNRVGSYPMWNSNTTYAQNQLVAGVDGNVYQSVQNSNTGHNPVGSVFNSNTPSTNWWVQLPGAVNAWTTAFKTGTTNDQWLQLSATLENVNIVYPVGTGPAFNQLTRNVFQLPNGYLRMVPQDPRAGAVSFLGAPSGLQFKDWEIEGNYIVSRTPYPIMVRFVADVTQVPTMDPMFCEALAARLGDETCETINQNDAKKATCQREYSKWVQDAKTTNGIEIGPVEAPLDDYLACRM